jgi:hypothetical protein
MHFKPDMTGDKSDDPFNLRPLQHGAGIRTSGIEPINPQPAIWIDHDLYDLAVGKSFSDHWTEGGLQHGLAAGQSFFAK